MTTAAVTPLRTSGFSSSAASFCCSVLASPDRTCACCAASSAALLPVCVTCCHRPCMVACSCSRGLAAVGAVSCTTCAAAACAATDRTHSKCSGLVSRFPDYGQVFACPQLWSRHCKIYSGGPAMKAVGNWVC